MWTAHLGISGIAGVLYGMSGSLMIAVDEQGSIGLQASASFPWETRVLPAVAAAGVTGQWTSASTLGATNGQSFRAGGSGGQGVGYGVDAVVGECYSGGSVTVNPGWSVRQPWLWEGHEMVDHTVTLGQFNYVKSPPVKQL